MSSNSGRSILVVEDDREIRQALCELLVFEGYQVQSSSDGQQALDLLRQGFRPDLILLDLMMPIKSGVQFREEQLLDPQLSGIPVIVLSADSNIRTVSGKMGVARFLTKPVNLEDLLQALESAL